MWIRSQVCGAYHVYRLVGSVSGKWVVGVPPRSAASPVRTSGRGDLLAGNTMGSVSAEF
jgi:hypothetical protein